MNSSKESGENFKLLLASANIIQKHQTTLLQGVHIYKNKNDYIFTSAPYGRRYCTLCEMSTLTDVDWEEHVRSERHETRYFQLFQAQKQLVRQERKMRLERAEFLRERSMLLKLPRWQWHVNHLIMQYIDTPFPECNSSRREPDCTAAMRQLAKYEQMERLTLLELAILKSNRRVDSESFSDDESTKSNSSNNESQMIKNGAAIVIPLVVSFLGKPPPIDETKP
jgi:hypothetical protein